MPERKQLLESIPVDEELARLLEEIGDTPVTEEELREQRISFAFGNAPMTSKVSKESVRRASENIKLMF